MISHLLICTQHHIQALGQRIRMAFSPSTALMVCNHTDNRFITLASREGLRLITSGLHRTSQKLHSSPPPPHPRPSSPASPSQSCDLEDNSLGFITHTSSLLLNTPKSKVKLLFSSSFQSNCFPQGSINTSEVGVGVDIGTGG